MAAEIFPTKLPSIVERMCPGVEWLCNVRRTTTGKHDYPCSVSQSVVHSLGQNGISHENGQSNCRFSPVVDRNNAWNTSFYPGKRIIFLLRQNRPQNLKQRRKCYYECSMTRKQIHSNKTTRLRKFVDFRRPKTDKKRVNTPLYLNRILDFILCPCRCSVRVQQSIWLGNGP